MKSSNNNLVIVDYGMGNIRSISSILEFLNMSYKISSSPEEIKNSKQIILPGVGSFRIGINNLKKLKIDKAIIESLQSKKTKILGICLGFQLMFESSTEDGFSEGLGIIEGKCERFNIEETDKGKIPHIGFNNINVVNREGLFRDFGEDLDFYFVHSYRILAERKNGHIATCGKNKKFLAAYHLDNIYGTQFHPEKSQTNGILLMKNFLEN